ncbi:MAG: RNA polymerase sigma factor, partial [Acidimicrobiales bacterium]
AALGHHALGDYQIQAAIAAVHDQAPSYAETNWAELRALYNLLLRRRDNRFVRLNRAVAIAHNDGPDTALREIKSLSEPLADHHRYHATIGYIQDLAGRHAAAESAYQSAARLATNEPERQYLRGKANQLARRIDVDARRPIG